MICNLFYIASDKMYGSSAVHSKSSLIKEYMVTILLAFYCVNKHVSNMFKR